MCYLSVLSGLPIPTLSCLLLFRVLKTITVWLFLIGRFIAAIIGKLLFISVY